MLFGTRPWPVVVFFVLLGMTNLVKGLGFGTAMAAIPIAGWLIWNRDWRRCSKYAWFWGALIFGAILAAWPLAARWRVWHGGTAWSMFAVPRGGCATMLGRSLRSLRDDRGRRTET